MKQALFLWKMYWLAILLPLGSFAQTPKVDSLQNLLRKTAEPASKLKLLFALCEERASLDSDTLYTYTKTAENIAKAKNDKWNIAKANYYLCYVLLKKSLLDSAIALSDTQLEWLKNDNAPQALVNDFCYIRALALVRSSQYKEAVNQYYQLLSNAEKANDTLMEVRAKTGIGWVNMELNQNTEAVLWFRKALATTSNQQLLDQYGVVYANIASVYNNLHKPDSAIYFINKALSASRQYENLTNLANSLYIQSVFFIGEGNNKAAEAALNEGLEVRKRIGDPFYIVSDMAQLALFYASIYQYEKGIAIAQQGIDIAWQYKLDAKLAMLYTSLGENLKGKGDYKAYSEIEEKLLLLKDSLFEKNSAEALARLQTKYSLQRQENIIIQKNLDIVRRDYLLYSIIAVFGFVLIIIFIVYQNYQKRQKLTMEKLVKEQQQKETIAVLEAEEAERKRIAADLHDNLGAYAAAISADVQLFKINSTTHTQQVTSRIEANVGDMVSHLNNTIWVLKKKSQRLTEISDRFKVWMQKLMQSYPNIVYDFDENIENDQQLSSTAALHLFHLLQEGVNNAVRHSGCSRITVSIESNHQWAICIADNGTGPIPQMAESKSGIANMKQRAKACGWQISWKENGAQGTAVYIRE